MLAENATQSRGIEAFAYKSPHPLEYYKVTIKYFEICHWKKCQCTYVLFSILFFQQPVKMGKNLVFSLLMFLLQLYHNVNDVKCGYKNKYV